MDDISYKEMESMYNEVSKSTVKPDLTVTNLETARAIWGDEQVDAWIADGTIKFLGDFVMEGDDDSGYEVQRVPPIL